MSGSRSIARRLLGWAPVAVVLAILAPVARPVVGSGDTFQFWYAGHLLATGRSPYDASAWEAAAAFGDRAANVMRNCGDGLSSACVWVYPPTTAWLFFPFAFAGPVAGGVLIDVFVLVTALVGVAMVLRTFGPKAHRHLMPLVVMVVGAYPFVGDVRNGHFAGLLLIGVALVALGLAQRRTTPLAVGSVILLAKPHLFAALALVVVLDLIVTRAYRSLAITTLTVVGVMGIAFLGNPEALDAMLTRSLMKVSVALAGTWGVAETLVPSSPLIPWAAIVLLGAFCLAAAIRRSRGDANVIVAGGTALSLLVTPYAQPADLLLVAPALALAVRFAESGGARSVTTELAIVALTYTAASWGTILFGAFDPFITKLFGLVPAVALLQLASAPLEPTVSVRRRAAPAAGHALHRAAKDATRM